MERKLYTVVNFNMLHAILSNRRIGSEKNRFWLIAVILSLSTNYAFSQGDYIATDSTLSSGIKLMEGTARDNAQFIRLIKKHRVIKYLPNDLSEFGFKNGKVYVSKNISVLGKDKRVFLERLVHGSLTLYYYTEKGFKTYFIEKDSTVFIEIPKEKGTFKKRISKSIDDYEWMEGPIRLVKYKRKSLSKLASLYNNGQNRPFPYMRFGIVAGYNSTKLIVPSEISNEFLGGISFSPTSSILAGFYADIPIEMSDFSINAGMNFAKSGFSVNSQTSLSDVDIVVNILTMELPVLLRYTLPTVRWRPFVNIGGNFSYHLENSNEIYSSSIVQNTITINDTSNDSFVSDNMFGFLIGTGLQYNLNYRKTVSAELRYGKFFGTKDTLNKDQLSVLIGFSF